MKIGTRLLAVAAGLLAVNVGLAQAPAGSTGQCKDGTYTSAASKSGACRGHKGIQTWYATAAAPAAAPTGAKAAVPEAATAPMTPAPAKSTRQSGPSMQQAPGGGLELVWVNTVSKIYHCPGTKYYGKTKEGKYMSESEAKAMGARPDHGNACSK